MDSPRNAHPSGRPFIGVIFECCGVYQRIYRAPEATAYRGCCPKCLRAIMVPVGKEGTGERFFRGR